MSRTPKCDAALARLSDQETSQLQIVYRDPASLIPYANNSRKHSHEQLQAIAASIKEFGFLQPVLVDKKSGIVAGHARVQAATQLLSLESIPTISVETLTAAQIKLFVIADNRLAEMSSWDETVLKLELANLAEEGMAWDWLEMPDLTLVQELPPVDADRENDQAEPAADPVVKPGDLWRCGPHLVLCGDSTNPDHVAQVLNGASPNVCVTDPPYGTNYDPKWRNEALAPANRSIGVVENDNKVNWTDALSLFTGNVFYVWHAGRHATEVAISLADMDFEIRCQLIWMKDAFAISRGHYHWQHEPCWYAVRKGQRSNWKGDRKSSTVWSVPRIKSNAGDEDKKTGHSTQKPIDLVCRPYRNHCEPGDHVYEPFLGSGTAMIAAHKCGLICHSIEISPAHVEGALVRFRNVAGVEPTLPDGTTLASLQAKVQPNKKSA